MKSAISDKRSSVHEIYNRKKKDYSNTSDKEIPKIEITFSHSAEKERPNKPTNQSYHYEIGKIATKRNSMDFDFFGGILRNKCADNDLVQNELNHMERNIDNEIEYYTSLRLIDKELNEK